MPTLKKILYVEDETDIQAIARVALETVGGYDVKICSSGEEAVNCARDYEPDIFILDVMMPGMDGPQTLAKLRGIPEFDRTPAIFMTAKVQESEIRQFKSMGVMDVIPKPFDPMTLARQIQECWNQYYSR